jgi:hypothetical protein
MSSVSKKLIAVGGIALAASGLALHYFLSKKQKVA